MPTALSTEFDELRDWLLRIATYARSDFFRLWNRLNEGPDSVGLSANEKLLKILPHLGDLKPVRLPPEIRFVSWLDSEYPEAFHRLPQAPLGFFVNGLWRAEEPRAGVIGSRKPLPYALRMTTDIVRALIGRSLAVVSGGAYGIDIEAHRVCLEEGGRAVCVLGSGLRALYPKAHERYFERMLSSGGVLVSEYPPHELPRPWTFPERNRLIAALSDFVVLAQAHGKSGSLSTARTALDLGKEVFVLRPVPEDPAFDGSRVLIDSGATILTEPAQLN